MPMLNFLSRKDAASSQQQQPTQSDPPTPGPAFPGGPGPDTRTQAGGATGNEDPMNVSSAAGIIHTPPSPASSIPRNKAPPSANADHPRFVEHVAEGTTDSTLIAPPLPTRTGNNPMPPPSSQSVTHIPPRTSVEAPPQHPAVSGIGATNATAAQSTAPKNMPEPQPAPAPAPGPPPANHDAMPMPVPVPAPIRASSPTRGGRSGKSPAPASRSPVPDPNIVRPSDPVTADQTNPNGHGAAGVGPTRSILRNTSLRSKHARGGSEAAAGGGGGGSVQTGGSGNGSTFAGGAATVVPFVDPGLADELNDRAQAADEELSEKERAKINKDELKHNRRLSRVIRKEASTQSQALDLALRELSDLQKLQKLAIRDEGDAHSAHARAIAHEHRAELAMIAAKQAHEKAGAELRTAEEALEASRTHARETTELLREKAEEVETLRMQKGADDRERAVRVRELVGDEKKGIGRFFGL